ncbi:MAG TPA: MBL fold metallo-hydrolase [Chitinophagales bacterium]|nr:MBL fold metallo-hydrolase [Chitinophagales bacterium]
MKIQKLNWAGVKLECGNKTILIDAVENFKPYFPVLGNPLTPLVNFTHEIKADYILFTHLHLDHFDTSVIEKCLKPEGKIIGYVKHEKEISKLNRDFVLLNTNELFEEHGISFKPVYSLDGIGEEQTAWIVGYDGKKILHGGDTIWHNQFWKLAKENAGITYAFLPINGAIVNFQMVGLEYSTVPASLTPEQAFNAAKLLHAEKLIPIHYGKFATPFYQPIDTSETVLNNLSESIKQPFQLVSDGEFLN